MDDFISKNLIFSFGIRSVIVNKFEWAHKIWRIYMFFFLLLLPLSGEHLTSYFDLFLIPKMKYTRYTSLDDHKIRVVLFGAHHELKIILNFCSAHQNGFMFHRCWTHKFPSKFPSIFNTKCWFIRMISRQVLLNSKLIRFCVEFRLLDRILHHR